jgi:hypothetical protein
VTGNELADHVGRCDRENSCGYHYTPKQFFTDHPELGQNARETSEKQTFGNQYRITRNDPETCEKRASGVKNDIVRPIDFLPFDLMDRSVSRHEECDLFPFLVKLFRKHNADQLCNDYFIGTNKDGYTCYWQVDAQGRVRQCKIIHYLPNGHRDKKTSVLFAGKKILNSQDANLKQCFFGEFLLSLHENKTKPVAVVESEKSAVICSVYYPDFIWLATGGKNGAGWTERNVCKVLSGRKVILFPDLNAFDSWKSKGLLMAATAGCKVVISDLLEKNATDEEKQNGLDLADYLLRVQDGTGLALTDHDYPVIFDYGNKPVLTGFES